ncbi:MAG: hypothetical protein ACI8PQ_000372 [Planctomycetota bacterium]|jgi:hypothetical protein
MQSKATTVAEYLKSLPEDRRKALQAVRKVILANKDKDITEGIQYGMIGYFISHKRYPDGYHCDPKQPLPFAALASQKNHMAVYMMCIYVEGDDGKAFREDWAKSGKKLDLGKSCLRFKKIEDVALDVIGKTFKRMTAKKYIAAYEAAWGTSAKPRARKA